MDHEFVIPVYGRAPHLEACIRSILGQVRARPRLLIATSTPSPEIAGIGAAFGIPVFVNAQRADIATDWNFAVAQSSSRFVTIAHQDDLYAPEYLETMTRLAGLYPGQILAFSAYREHTDAGARPANLNLWVKARLCARVFRGQAAISTVADKRRLLSLGNPVCCPSVMLNRARAPGFRFSASLKTNLDWDAWLRLSASEGEFVHTPLPLVSKRVHRDSETTATIANRVRQAEDLHMFRQFWPRPVAALVAAVYSIGYAANRV
jgi:glycosyltransferase involved in cell wall biosynthesis